MSDVTDHDEIGELLGAYALNAVEADERTRVQDHLRTCRVCQAEVDQHRETAALLANTGGEAPEGVWDRIAAELEPPAPEMRIEVNGEESATVVPLGERRRRPFSSNLGKGIMAAAAVVIIALGAVLLAPLFNGSGDDESTRTLETVAMDALADPESRSGELTDASGQSTAPVAITEEGAGYLLPSRFADLEEGRVYQLWSLTEERTISLGTFEPDDRVVPFRVQGEIGTVAVTNEESGGVPAPTSPPIASTEL